MDSNKTPQPPFPATPLFSRHHFLCLLDTGSFCKGYYSRISSCKTYHLTFFFSWFHTQHNFVLLPEREERKTHLANRSASRIPIILTASKPALVALIIATVATGTPLGICIIIKIRTLWWSNFPCTLSVYQGSCFLCCISYFSFFNKPS